MAGARLRRRLKKSTGVSLMHGKRQKKYQRKTSVMEWFNKKAAKK